ncbi:hypothetical protein [Dactylosporangium sp. NPDC051541]|uniref:hypothetical protein n=1 Tax=Dactylosporangium sp. NPDC051541 TaxID=3363977 RepID=UPI0037B1AFDB
MPPALVRPYVRVIPIAHIKPAPARRSTVPPRAAPPVYRPRHDAARLFPPPPPPRPRPRRRTPALAWGALLVTLATTAITLRPTAAPTVASATAAESGQLQTAMVPAQLVQQAPSPRRPDAPPPPAPPIKKPRR